MQARLASVAGNAISNVPHCKFVSVFTHQFAQLCNLRFNILPFKAYASISAESGSLACVLAKWKVRRQAWNTDH